MRRCYNPRLEQETNRLEVATMKQVLAVASFCLAVSFVPSAVGQTRDSGAKKQAQRVSSRSGSLQICQGVPLPDGYVIVAYVTTTACPHGAYVLKKKSPVADATGGPSQVAVPNAASSQTAVPKAASSQSTTSQAAAATAAKAVSRPRRVQGDDRGDASVIASSPTGPPTLSGTTPALGAPVNAPATAAATTDEEVEAGDVVRIETSLVAVPVSVLDRQGRFIPGLRREDFRVFENGVEQAIAYFEPSEKPFTVALLLDTSASTRFHLWEIREAAIAFAKQLRPQDRVLVVTFSDEVLLLTEATNDLEVVNAVIQTNATPGSATRLYDAVNLVIAERLNKIQGRKAIVLFTDGVDTASNLATYESTLREAEELDALVYPIQYDTTDYMRAMQNGGSVSVVTTTRGNWPFPGSSSTQTIPVSPPGNLQAMGATSADYDRANQYLHGMADRTGGRLYQANDRKQLDQAFSSIAEELRRQYSLGYYEPSPSDPASGDAQASGQDRRAITVRVNRPNVAVRARNSYLRKASTTSPPQQ
ncbi:MAG: VWA domain-containing protein [Acidobacteria bacterium]|nr:VWA domain-containing protein [Acidobacteriota bacterium]